MSTEPTDYWRGEMGTRMAAAETRLNALNGDLRKIRTHMEGTRGELLVVTNQMDELHKDVNAVLSALEEQRKLEVTRLQTAMEAGHIRVRNIIFLITVPLICALISGVIPLLVIKG